MHRYIKSIIKFQAAPFTVGHTCLTKGRREEDESIRKRSGIKEKGRKKKEDERVRKEEWRIREEGGKEVGGGKEEGIGRKTKK